MTLPSVRLTRLHVHRRLGMWNWTGNIDDAVLVASELVANAVRHAKVAGHELWLRLVELDDGELEIHVSDPVGSFPEFTAGGPAIETGRGLLVVRQLAYDVDWFPRAEVGKTVRARLATVDIHALATESRR